MRLSPFSAETAPTAEGAAGRQGWPGSRAPCGPGAGGGWSPPPRPPAGWARVRLPAEGRRHDQKRGSRKSVPLRHCRFRRIGALAGRFPQTQSSAVALPRAPDSPATAWRQARRAHGQDWPWRCGSPPGAPGAQECEPARISTTVRACPGRKREQNHRADDLRSQVPSHISRWPRGRRRRGRRWRSGVRADRWIRRRTSHESHIVSIS